jgi:hypothetical protein
VAEDIRDNHFEKVVIWRAGPHPGLVVLIGLVFASVSGTITFLLSVPTIDRSTKEYVQQNGYSGVTDLSLGFFFFEFMFVPGLFVAIYSIGLPILYARQRARGDQIRVLLTTGVVLLITAAFFWLFLGLGPDFWILGGQALAVTALFCVAFSLLMNRLLKR